MEEASAGSHTSAPQQFAPTRQGTPHFERYHSSILLSNIAHFYIKVAKLEWISAKAAVAYNAPLLCKFLFSQNYLKEIIICAEMNYANALKDKLKKYGKEDIIITDHAQEQAIFRSVDLEEIKENIINPKRLSFAGKQEAQKEGEEKYDCYFGYSNTLCHRYLLVINNRCIVCTVIKINRRWQYIMEKNAKV